MSSTWELWENPNSLPVPGDYDGDGKTDPAVYNPATSAWTLQQSRSGLASLFFGWSHNDVPVPADYDGDGRTDLAVYRPNGDCVSGVGIWEIRTPAGGIQSGELWWIVSRSLP